MRRTLAFAFFAVAVAGLLVSTSGADVVTHQDTDVLELEPAGDGTYTQIDDDTGEIQIILTEENPNLNANGVNGEAVTDIGPVFTIQNVLDQQSDATVWIDHSSDAVTFTDGDGNAIQSESEGVELQPGDDLTVHMRVDSRGVDEVELDGITVMATLDPAVETETETTTNDVESGGSTNVVDATTETPEDSTTDTSNIRDGVVTFEGTRVTKITFDDDVRGSVTVEDVEEVPEGVTEPDGFVAGAEITVPDALEDEPATIEFTATESELDGTDAEDLELAHYDGESWTMLETTVMEVNGDQYVFEAQTFDFSLFAVVISEDEATSTETPTSDPAADDPTTATETPSGDGGTETGGSEPADTETPSDGTATKTESSGSTGEQAGLDVSPWFLAIALLVGLFAGVGAYRVRREN